MSISLKDIASKRGIYFDKDTNCYKPKKGYLIIYGDVDIVAYISFDHSTNYYTIESAAGVVGRSVRDTTRDFQLFKEV